MENKKVLISTDCTCDLSPELREILRISVMYCYVITEEGRYQDTNEMTSDNLLEYMEEEKKEAFSDVASIEEYKEYFEKLREKTKGPIIHISMARFVSNAYNIALEAAADLENVFVIDSGQLSGGLGLVVLRAADLAARGASLTLLLKEIQRDGEQVYSSFVAQTTRYLYKNNNMKKATHLLCKLLHLHPVIRMKESRMALGTIHCGSESDFAHRYIRWVFRHKGTIDTDLVYLIGSGYSYEYLEMLKKEITDRIPFCQVFVNDASASIAANCGPGAVGIMYFRR